MPKLTKKALHAAAAPLAKAAARYANNYLLRVTPNPRPAGVVSSHYGDPHATPLEWEGYTLEASMCRRPAVVCNVPTPYSLYTFNYCLKRDGRQLAHGTTLAEFCTHAMRAIRRDQEGAAS